MVDDRHHADTATESLREVIAHDPEALKEYLKQSFLMDAMLSLFQARRQANLTQRQVAERLGTKQSVIARWEADFTGAISLRNYVDFALACEVRPFDVTLAPVGAFVPFANEHPDQAITVEAYHRWLRSATDSVPMSGNTFTVTATPATPTVAEGASREASSNLGHLSASVLSALNRATPMMAQANA